MKSSINLFIARDLTLGKASPEEDEEIELVKMPLEEAVDCVMQGKIKNSIASLGILILKDLKQRGTL